MTEIMEFMYDINMCMKTKTQTVCAIVLCFSDEIEIYKLLRLVLPSESIIPNFMLLFAFFDGVFTKV